MTKRYECFRCGRPVPKRRGLSFYCSKKCETKQEAADRESGKLERDLQESGYVSEWHSSDPGTDHGR